MIRYELDDPLDAVAVHGGGGNHINVQYNRKYRHNFMIISNDF